jgi:hypothetical protein
MRRLHPMTWAGAASVGAVLLVGTAWANGGTTAIPWYLAVVGSGVAIVLASRLTWFRTVTRGALVAYAVAVPIVVIVAGAAADANTPRIALHTDNPNLLAADIVTVVMALLVVMRPRRSSVLLLALALVAVLYTGSRTGMVALALGSLGWFLRRDLGGRVRAAGVGMLAVFGLFLGLMLWQIGRYDASPNILWVSTSMAHPAWDTSFAEEVIVDARVERGPFLGTRADRVRATSGDHPLVIYQPVERSIGGQPYVASVYLRADEPQTVVLSFQLALVTCQVGPAWSRCVTPSAPGNDHASAQLRLETAQPRGSFDVFVYGPQFERSDVVGPYAPKRPPFVPASVLRRFGLDILSSDEPAVRWIAADRAWQAFRSSPWVGLGVDRWRAVIQSDLGGDATVALGHAHNLVLERLATEGIVGLVGWLLVYGAAISAALGRGRGAVLPLVLALVALNLTDMTLFHQGSFIATWMAVGIVWSDAGPTDAAAGPRARARAATDTG